MSEDFYAELAPVYDRMIPWERRLAREAPWFEEIWRRTGARRVLDASCGSGGHLPLFAAQGLAVTAADASAAMLALARERAETIAPERRPALVHAIWSELPEKVEGAFDAVLCLGNSLPYVTDDDALRASLAGLWAKVAPGGLLLIQLKNFARRRGGADRLLPLSACFGEGAEAATTSAQGDTVVVRVYDWEGDRVIFNVLALQRAGTGAPWALRQHATPLRPWSADRLTAELCALGARVRTFGSLALAPFDAVESEDLVVWATRHSGTRE